MNYELMHPRDQIVAIMNRIYQHGMTTTSGGNLSILDENGDLWISPTGVDKGKLRPQDIVCVRAGGEIEGIHRPSSEYPFHKDIYEARPGVRAVLHAHPVALVSFSIVGQVPDTMVMPQSAHVCGPVGFAPYAVPGSAELGRRIADTFREGFDCVVLENHGVVCAGETLLEAYHRFETLDFCARLLIKAAALGPVTHLTSDQIALSHTNRNFLPEFEPGVRTGREKELRREMVDLVHRAYNQHIMTCTEGTLSARLDEDTFLITPYGVDRSHLDLADVVLVRDGRRERGKLPSRSVIQHKTIYDRHPDIHAVVTAQAPNSTAFSLVERGLDTRTIPESYIVLRDVPVVPYGMQFNDEAGVAAILGPACPVVLLQNDSILATGGSVLQAFDRLEVAEFTAESLINALTLGALRAINDERLKELCEAFNLS